MQNDLRWLLRRGSPLPIPNREVKPVCADGTAICGRVCRCLFLESPHHLVDGDFLFWFFNHKVRKVLREVRNGFLPRIDTVQKKCVKLKICNFKLLTINLQTNELYTRTNL